MPFYGKYPHYHLTRNVTCPSCRSGGAHFDSGQKGRGQPQFWCDCGWKSYSSVPCYYCYTPVDLNYPRDIAWDAVGFYHTRCRK